MKYNYYPGPEDVESRKMLNDKVLYLIDSGTAAQAGITSEDVYNAYTGDGGLHGLDRKDYDNYHSYSEAKKEIENGQFFTPPGLCQLVAAALRPSQFDLVADFTCGKGSFFNFFPVESNLYGCEIDAKACKVARFLFPAANITSGDIRTYQPELRFEILLPIWIQSHDSLENEPPFEYPLNPLFINRYKHKKRSEPLTFISMPGAFSVLNNSFPLLSFGPGSASCSSSIGSLINRKSILIPRL